MQTMEYYAAVKKRMMKISMNWHGVFTRTY